MAPTASTPTPAPIPLRRRLLLSSDFDDTLVGARHDARHTAAAASFAAVFPRLAHPPCGSRALLVVNTGRTLPLFEGHRDAEARLDALGLRPAALVAGVGTRVYWPRQQQAGAGARAALAADLAAAAAAEGGGAPVAAAAAAAAAGATATQTDAAATTTTAASESKWVEDAEWTLAVGAGWDPAAARRAVEAALAATPARLDARLQPERELHAHKLTCSLAGTEEDAGRLRAEITRRFGEEHAREAAATGAPRFVIGLSGAASPGGGGAPRYVVDVLPQGGGKCNAMVYVARRLGYSSDEVASAGDGHNDESMLALAPGKQRRAIVVGNAAPGLRARLGGLGLAHVWVAPEESVGAAAVLAGLSADEEAGGEGWFDAAEAAVVW